MNKGEKSVRIYKKFSSLSEDKKDYILGILQALVFAKNEGMNKEPNEQNIEKKRDHSNGAVRKFQFPNNFH
jgi:hypothetical protein